MRSKGLLAALELVTNKTTKEKPAPNKNIGQRLARAGYENNLIFRANADATITLAPPICIVESDIDLLMDRLEKTLELVMDIKE